jgi:hypothetical protein
MKFDLGKSKLIAGLLISLGIFVLGSNTYNSIVSTGLIDVEGVIKSSFTSLLSIVGGITTLMAHKVDADGNKLVVKKENKDEMVE